MTKVTPGDLGSGEGATALLNDPVIGQFRKTLTDTTDANIVATVGTF